jgi:phosphotransferase system enzyme I (PtsP)
MGYRRLSMSPASIGPVKAMILATDLASAQKFVRNLVEADGGGRSMRERLQEFAEAKGIPL